jgi:hypothetical protein
MSYPSKQCSKPSCEIVYTVNNRTRPIVSNSTEETGCGGTGSIPDLSYVICDGQSDTRTTVRSSWCHSTTASYSFVYSSLMLLAAILATDVVKWRNYNEVAYSWIPSCSPGLSRMTVLLYYPKVHSRNHKSHRILSWSRRNQPNVSRRITLDPILSVRRLSRCSSAHQVSRQIFYLFFISSFLATFCMLHFCPSSP